MSLKDISVDELVEKYQYLEHEESHIQLKMDRIIEELKTRHISDEQKEEFQESLILYFE